MFKKRASDDQIHIELGQEDQSFFFHPAADPLRITSREVYQEFQPSYDIDGRGCLDQRFRAQPQLATLPKR